MSTALSAAVEKSLRARAAANRDALVAAIRDLVRIPSENTPPTGNELACQEYVAQSLTRMGWKPDLYRPDEAPGAAGHPLYWHGRDYRNRPNVGARRRGAGGGRSLVLSGHIDTVPAGTQPWTRDPFGGEIEGNRLYGRGSNDMKAGVAANLFVLRALADLEIELAGDLVFETVVDEEFGGVNGTLAGRLAGYNGDAAVISEPSFLRICAAQRGGRTAHITLSAPSGGILKEGGAPPGVIEQLRCFLDHLPEFTQRRRKAAPAHRLYPQPDPVPVSVARISTGPWGFREPPSNPDTCQIELFWQAMPGETVEEVDAQFGAWIEDLVAAEPRLFASRPRVEFPIRWLPGSAIDPDEPLVRELSACAADVLGKPPAVVGIEGPCDMYVFHQVAGTPAVLWGARGGNTHKADEYVELDSAAAAAETLLLFVCRWCGVR